MTSCDKLWLRINGRAFAVLMGTLPIAAFIPEVSLIVSGALLFWSCKSFLTMGSRVGDYKALSLLLSMPFSREQIFRTYGKGILGLGGVCFLSTAVLRGVLWGWGVDINRGLFDLSSGMGLVKYLLLLLLFLVIVAIFQLNLLMRWVVSDFYALGVASFFIAVPGLYVLFYLGFITTTGILEDVFPEGTSGEIILERIVDGLSAAVIVGLVAGFVFLLSARWMRAGERFSGRREETG